MGQRRGGRAGHGRRRDLGAIAAAIGLGVCPLAGWAQVIEVGADGAVRTFNGPTLFTSHGASPIAAPPELASRPTVRATRLVVQAADAAALSPQLVEAVAWQESHLRPRLISSAGAIGEMQLMPATARNLKIDPYDSQQNYFGGAAYLRSLVSRYDGNIILALAAYNAGPHAVDKYGGVPPYKETRAYVAAIMERLARRAQAASPPRIEEANPS